MNDTSYFWTAIGLLVLFAMIRREYWGFFSMLLGLGIGYLAGIAFDDSGLVWVLAISLALYFAGKFVGKRYSGRNTMRSGE